MTDLWGKTTNVPRYRMTKRFPIMLLLVSLLVTGTVTTSARLLGGSEPESATVVVEIPEGTGAGEVGDLLAEAGVLANAWVFRLQARFDDRASRIRPGRYELMRDMSAGDVLTLLSAAPEAAATFTVTIPEGLSVDETLDTLAEAEGSPFSRRQLRAALEDVAVPGWVPDELPEGAEPFEGLLFPDTYEFRRDDRAAAVLDRLVDQTSAVVDSVGVPEGIDTYELLTAASLIEREARIDDERAKVSSVIYNRLEDGMALQIDATVLYALGEHQERVLLSDLEVDSPWNTYEVTGLPPTPISGAGAASIVAAAEPDDTDFLYYVVVNPETGRHAFSETYDEFLADKARAQEG